MVFGPNNIEIQPGIIFFEVKIDIFMTGKIIHILIMKAARPLTKTKYSCSRRGVKLLVSCIRLQKDRSFYQQRLQAYLRTIYRPRPNTS